MKTPKYLVLASFSLIIFIYGLTGVALFHSRQHYQLQAALSAQNLVQASAQNVKGILDKLDVGLFAVSSEAARQLAGGGIDKKSMGAYLAMQKERLRDFEGLWAADEKGNIYWGTQLPDGKPVNISDREYFRQLKGSPHTRIAISELVMGRITKDWSILVAQRVNRADGSLAGAVLGSLRAVDYFTDMFSSLDLGAGGNIVIRDSELGLIVQYPKPANMDDLIGSKVLSAKTLENIRVNPVSATYAAISARDNIEKIISYQKVADYPLYVFASQSTEYFLAPWWKEVMLALGLLGLFTLAALLFIHGIRSRTYELLTAQREVLRVKALEAEAEICASELAQRQQIEAKLNESDNKYRLLVEGTNDIVYSMLPDGTLNYISPQISRYGWTAAELEGNSFLQVISEEDRARLGAEFAQVIGSGQEMSTEFRGLAKSGELIWFFDNGKVQRDAQGNIVGVAGVLVDITYRKLAEAEHEALRNELLQSQKMESVGRLAGGVAHDFNNLLTAIGGYAEFLLRGLAADDPRREDAKEILSAAERAGMLTRQLLAFSRKQILNPQIIDINSTIAGTVNMLRRLIGEDIKLETKLFSQPCIVKVDAGQIAQVLVNLAVNSRDAMPGGGVIVLETGLVTPEKVFFAKHPDLTPGPMVLLSISDTGCGISDAAKEHLFEPFFTTKVKGKGTGLGLSTVFGIVKQSGGAIEVESALNHGTIVRIYLPSIEDAAFNKDSPTGINEGNDKDKLLRGTETILLVEDEESLRRLTDRVLRACGYTVISAVDGKDAIAAAERYGKPVDLLLTDVIMPGMNGRELAQRLETSHLAARTLYMSGYTDEAIIKHGVLEAGIAFIYKPFTVEALSIKLREVLDGPADKAKS